METGTVTPSEDKGPELFFALVYPVGTDADLLVDVLSGALAEVGYHPDPLHLIDVLSPAAQATDLYEKYMKQMNEGNALRERSKRADAFALYYASEITKYRAAEFADKNVDERINSRWAYIIRSLKRPEEVVALRAIYGDALVVMAAHSTTSGSKRPPHVGNRALRN